MASDSRPSSDLPSARDQAHASSPHAWIFMGRSQRRSSHIGQTSQIEVLLRPSESIRGPGKGSSSDALIGGPRLMEKKMVRSKFEQRDEPDLLKQATEAIPAVFPNPERLSCP